MEFTTKHEPEPSALDDPLDRPATGQSASPGTSETAEPPVANLIEGYRSKRTAWIAEAEALARMRDEVRGAAERERMEIVTRARERARAVIANARRNLLTLTAQVEASLGPTEPPTPVAELFRGGTRQAVTATTYGSPVGDGNGGNGAARSGSPGNGTTANRVGTTATAGHPADGRWTREGTSESQEPDMHALWRKLSARQPDK